MLPFTSPIFLGSFLLFIHFFKKFFSTYQTKTAEERKEDLIEGLALVLLFGFFIEQVPNITGFAFRILIVKRFSMPFYPCFLIFRGKLCKGERTCWLVLSVIVKNQAISLPRKKKTQIPKKWISLFVGLNQWKTRVAVGGGFYCWGSSSRKRHHELDYYCLV